MADLSLVATGKVNIIESFVQMTLPLAEAINVGEAVRLDPTTGKFTKANGTTAAEARIYGLLVSKDGAGAVGTALHEGVVDGFDLDALSYDADVFLSNTDGALADAAGTVSTVIGRVIPATSTKIGVAYDKLLLVDCF